MRLWPVYHEDVPQFILEFASVDEMRRLEKIGMNCGLEYTNFPLYRTSEKNTRFDHSVGAALIVWHFTREMKQTVAALFHDIGTPVFAHVVDFMNEDHLFQESTEARTKEIISDSGAIMKLLKKYQLTVEDVCDYHLYPIADNDSPRLSADRLEYTLSNAVYFSFRTWQEAEAYYRDLTVVQNEDGIDEIAFHSPELAVAFTDAALLNSKAYVADEDRFAMQYLADLLRLALDRGVLRENDLYTTEPEVIAQLKGFSETEMLWNKLRSFSHILLHKTDPREPFWLTVPAKKRYINPLVSGLGRVSSLSNNIAEKMSEFLRHDFDYWIKAT